MCALVKIKNPVEYRFQKWIRHCPESTHPTDRRNFLLFVQNVCRFNAKKWKDVNYLERRILQIVPQFDSCELQNKLIIFEYLVDFYKQAADKATWSHDPSIRCSIGNYLEIGFRNNEFYEIEKPIPPL